MKKLFGMTIAMMLGISMIGCASTTEDTTVEEQEIQQEEQIEEEIEETEKEEVVTESEEEVDIFDFDEEEFKYYMTTNLPEEEYDEYFDGFRQIGDGGFVYQEVEFDASIDFMDLREGYDTRCELGLSSGDYSETEWNGPFIKVKDISIYDLNGLSKGSNVRIKATIDEYDLDKCWLVIDIIEIESR